jgi:diketogulonate reductase-like aldo/keto reductase
MTRVIFLVLWAACVAAASAEINEDNVQMISLTFPSSTLGLRIPRLGLGTAGLGSQTAHITHASLISGMRLIDTAQAPEWYNERGVGEGLQDYLRHDPEVNKESIVVITKVHPRSFEKKKMAAALLASSDSINGDSTSNLDVVLLWQVGWANLVEQMEMGKISAVGVSNFDRRRLEQLLEITTAKVTIIQNWMDPFHQDSEMRQFATENNIVYMGYSSFGTQWQGKFTENPVFSNEVLNKIALKHDTTVSDVVLSWLLQEEVVAIPRGSTRPHLIENAKPISSGIRDEAMRVFLDDADMQSIRSLDGTLGDL